ncbi:MAG: hypothetical protein V3S93_00375 [Methyloceanibacter sp.]
MMSTSSFSPQQFRQLGDVSRDAPSFIEGQHSGDVRLFTGLSRA